MKIESQNQKTSSLSTFPDWKTILSFCLVFSLGIISIL